MKSATVTCDDQTSPPARDSRSSGPEGDNSRGGSGGPNPRGKPSRPAEVTGWLCVRSGKGRGCYPIRSDEPTQPELPYQEETSDDRPAH